MLYLSFALQILLMLGVPVGLWLYLRQLEQWGWSYVMRQGSTSVKLPGGSVWVRFDSLARRGSPPHWSPEARLTRGYKHPVQLITWWKAGEPEPWLLATNSPTLREALRMYKRCMWIEEMFGDFRNGASISKAVICAISSGSPG